jgi:hypothetical protein
MIYFGFLNQQLCTHVEITAQFVIAIKMSGTQLSLNAEMCGCRGTAVKLADCATVSIMNQKNSRG